MRKLRLRDAKEHLTTEWHHPQCSELEAHALTWPACKAGPRGPPLPCSSQAAPCPVSPLPPAQGCGEAQKRSQSDQRSHPPGREGKDLVRCPNPQGSPLPHPWGTCPPHPPCHYEVETDYLTVQLMLAFCLPPHIVQRTTFQGNRLEGE